MLIHALVGDKMEGCSVNLTFQGRALSGAYQVDKENIHASVFMHALVHLHVCITVLVEKCLSSFVRRRTRRRLRDVLQLLVFPLHPRTFPCGSRVGVTPGNYSSVCWLIAQVTDAVARALNCLWIWILPLGKNDLSHETSASPSTTS